MKVVVLASGGLDSSLLCLLLKNRGFDVQPLFINYGQLASAREWSACESIVDYLGVDRPVYVDLRDFGKKIKSGLTASEVDVMAPYLPNRNLLFLTVASGYAVREGSSVLLSGY